LQKEAKPQPVRVKELMIECRSCLGCNALENPYFAGNLKCPNIDRDKYKRSYNQNIDAVKRILGSAEK
jgi:hypothetical protein